MFKKKIVKRTNVLEDANQGAQNEEPQNEPEESIDKEALEPRLRKAVKKEHLQVFSSSTIKEDYNRAANEITEDLRFKSRPELLGNVHGNATAENLVDADTSNDAKARYLRNRQLTQELREGKLEKGVYRGQAGYQQYIEKSESDISNSKYTGSIGPIRAPTNIRVTCRIDYNPSLCKDYHDTGYCSFGDSCIYIHDRGDYKSGWELEQEWEAEQKERAKRFQVSTKNLDLDGDEQESEDEDERKFPQVCGLCEEKFVEPVRTNCKDYFCEKCISNYYKTKKMCPVCNKKLDGNFNYARELTEHLKKLEAKKKAKEEARARNGQRAHGGEEDQNSTEAASEENLEKIVKEFKAEQKKGKSYRTSESDWML